MPELLMLCGIPTSGKSTYVERLKKISYWKNAVVLSTDNYIEQEAKKHDAIFYYEWLASLEDKKVGIDGYSKLWDKVRKGIDYFRKNNAEAYMVLLD